MQKVLIVTNANREPITGIGVYTNDLKRGFEELGFAVELKDYRDLLDRSNEMYRQANMGLVHAANACKHFTLLPWLRERLRDYDLIVINQPVFLPLDFYTFNHTLNKRMIHVIHDIGFLDLQWGKDRVVGKRELLSLDDFYSILNDKGRMSERVLDHKNSMIQLVPKQADVVQSLTDFDLMHWIVSTLSGGIDGHVICPTNVTRKLLQSAAYRFGLPDKNIITKYHFCPYDLPAKIEEPKPHLVMANLNWAKFDLDQLVSWFKEEINARLHVVCNYENEIMLKPILEATPSIKNRVTIQTAPSREAYLYLVNELRPALCYHPVAIFETFGFHLLEMAAAGVRTVVPKMEGGLQEVAGILGHTIDLDGKVNELADPRKKFCTPKAYAKELLELVYK